MGAGVVFASEMKRYADPATELAVVRLTSPAFASGLTAPHLRQFTRRADALIYWSERDGTRQLYRLDLKSGESKQLTSAAALDVSSFGLSPDDRYLYFFDGPVLQALAGSSLRAHIVYKVPEGAVRSGFTVETDGSLWFAEGSSMLRVAQKKTGPVFATEAKGGRMGPIMARPHHAQLLWRQGDAFHIANTDGAGRKQIALAAGITGEALWAPSGRTLLYLHVPGVARELISLREFNPDDGSDGLIAPTSQYGTFAPNLDASVFAGASRSKASAYIVILLRVGARELTLCEHHASDPSIVQIAFAPDSQSIVFVSDRDGKPALYRVPVEKFVEETEP